jgi:DNA-directed RNA polymerase subunit RPC12/RpoP
MADNMPAVTELFSIACLKCGKTLKCPVGAAGKKVKCPKCGELMLATLPANSGGSSARYEVIESIPVKPGFDVTDKFPASQVNTTQIPAKSADPISTLSFVCPACKRKLTFNSDDAGRKVNCGGCGQRVEIPSIPAVKTARALGALSGKIPKPVTAKAIPVRAVPVASSRPASASEQQT